jgi:hypothetical protein
MGIKNAEFDAELKFIEKVTKLVKSKIEFLTFITACKCFRPVTFLGDFFALFPMGLKFCDL